MTTTIHKPTNLNDMQYTCFKEDGKYKVMEHEGIKSFSERRLCALETLPEDAFDFWSKMEGKVFGEEVFEIGTDWDKTDAQSTTHDVAIPYLFKDTIPKQQEQDLWDEVRWLISEGLKDESDVDFVMNILSTYTLQKKH